jgi:tetratricopeptide (TPR) repeat protein/DNA-binding CsgD family transcriptional regulator
MKLHSVIGRGGLALAGMLVGLCLSVSGQNHMHIDSLKQALEHAEVDSVKVDLLVKISAEYSVTDLNEALPYAEKALEVAQNADEPRPLSDALINLGNVYCNQGLFEQALRHYYQYLEIQKQAGNQKETAVVLTNLGAINLNLKNYEQAKKNFEESVRIFESLPAPNSQNDRVKAMLSNYNNLGIVYQKVGDHQKAAYYYDKGINCARKNQGQVVVLAKLLNNLGDLYLDMEKIPEAQKAVDEALSIREKLGDQSELARSYRSLGRLSDIQGDTKQSLAYYGKGLGMARSVGNIPLQAELCGYLFDVFYNAGQADSALKYQMMLKNLNERMNFDETRKEMARIEFQSEYNQREKERKIEQQKRDFRLILVGVTLALSLVIISLLYLLSRNRLNRLRLEKDVVDLAARNLELEKKALEKELEIKNKELTTNVMYLVQKNEFISEIAQRLKSVSDQNPEQAARLSDMLIADLSRNTDEKIWKEFEVRFQEVHQDFYRLLNERFPGLTPNEKKLAAFLRLNMSTKDISAITFQSTDSIRIARSRLRKKLELSAQDNLIAFLESL